MPRVVFAPLGGWFGVLIGGEVRLLRPTICANAPWWFLRLWAGGLQDSYAYIQENRFAKGEFKEDIPTLSVIPGASYKKTEISIWPSEYVSY